MNRLEEIKARRIEAAEIYANTLDSDYDWLIEQLNWYQSHYMEDVAWLIEQLELAERKA